MMTANRGQTETLPRPAELLQRLIRFDTTNPPGNEADCVAYIRGLLEESGIATEVRARDPRRPNLIARLPGRGEAPPLMLYGHLDVVTTAGQIWRHPPFEGRIADGCIWGRGALDMKGGVAMMLSALLRAKAEGLAPAGDVLICFVSDEEASGAFGAKWLVESHRELFRNVRYALGEFGGFTLHLRGRRFYPIQVAEKQYCELRATIRGPGGHGALVHRGGAMAKLGLMLQRLDRKRLPVHVTPPVRRMLETMAQSLPWTAGAAIRLLLAPKLGGLTLKLLGARARRFEPLLSHTVNATIVRGGEKVNVIPSEITVDLDGRLLPGYSPADLISELRELLGDGVEFEVVAYDPGPETADLTLFETLAGVLRRLDPEALPIPFVLSAATDARFFAKLGIQTYGFTPMKLPPDFEMSGLVHGADERVPIEALDFGAEAFYAVLTTPRPPIPSPMEGGAKLKAPPGARVWNYLLYAPRGLIRSIQRSAGLRAHRHHCRTDSAQHTAEIPLDRLARG